ncbi:MAG: FtsX-like permease family protein [Thermoproteota archaeon]
MKIRENRKKEIFSLGKAKSILLVFVSFLIALLSIIFASSSMFVFGYGKNLSSIPPSDRIATIIDAINKSAIADTTMKISLEFSSRVSGYPEFERLTNYLVEKLLSCGVPRKNLYIQNFTLATPIDFGSKLIVNNKVIEAFAIWPNLFQTSETKSPISGRLIYGGRGTLEELNGKEVKDSIVMLEFDSADNWIQVANLGAKGVVFILPPTQNQGSIDSFDESIKKFSLTPFYFPRIAITYENGLMLKQMLKENENLVATIYVNMTLVNSISHNIIVVIPGTSVPEEAIVVTTHYDTWSVTPALAHNEDEASNIASVLELIKYYNSHPQKRTLIFAILSGHWEAIAGAREFTDWLLFSNNTIIQETKPLILLDFDFSTDSKTVSFLYRGFMYDFGSSSLIARWTKWLVPQIFNKYIPNIELATNETFLVENGFQGDYGWWTTLDRPYMLDSEPWAIAHGVSFSMRTASSRRTWGLPHTKVNFENLWPQLSLLNGIIYQLINEEKIDVIFQPTRFLFSAAGSDIAGFMTVQGSVVEYNIAKGWFFPVPKSIVVARRQGIYSSEYPFTVVITISDDNGSFTIHGISGYGYGHGYGRTDQWEFLGFHISNYTGMIDYAPDLGQYGRQFLSMRVVDRSPFLLTISTFKCSSIVMFDLIDPLQMIPKTFLDPRFKSTNIGSVSAWYSEPSQIAVIDFATLSEPIFWGTYLVPFEKLGMAFVQPNQKVILLYRLGPSLEIVGTLTNSSAVYPEGFGYRAPSAGEQLTLNFTVVRFFLDTFSLAKNRYQKLRDSYVRNTYSEMYLQKSSEYQFSLLDYLHKNNFSSAYSNALVGWNCAFHAYKNTMSIFSDVLNVDFFFMALFIVSSIFLERLFLNTYGFKRIVSVSAIMVIQFSAFYFVNPASKIVMSFAMLPLAVSILILLLFTLLIFFNDIKDLAKEYIERTMGKHFIEKPSGSLLQVAFTYGSQNLRKRKFRTFLVMFSVTTITFAMLALTSSYAAPRIAYSIASKSFPAYRGILVKGDPQRTPSNILSQDFANWIKTSYPNAIVSLRVWTYPQSVSGKDVFTYVQKGNYSYMVRAVLGLSSEENEVTNFTKFLISGSFFNKTDYYSVILPYAATKGLNVSVGDVVKLGYYTLKVKGVYNSSEFNKIKDLDGYTFSPVDPLGIQSILIGPVVSQGLTVNYLSGDQIVIVPSNLAIKLGGYISSVAIRIDNDAERSSLTDLLSYTISRQMIYSSDGNVVKMPVLALGLSLQGWSTMTIPLAIGALTILSTLIGGVMERISEIKTYSAVGIDPFQISIIFISESLIYALSAGAIGYIIGIIANIMLLNLGVLPSDFIVNTSSLPTALAVATALVSTILSAAYPSWIASKLVTPSLERRWKLPTKPKGDEWYIPLPFSTKDLPEALGVLNYIKEYLEAHKVETPEPFIVVDVDLNKESYVLSCNMALQPLESGVTQRIEIAIKTLEARTSFEIKIVKLSGPRDTWESVNYNVVDSLRKQMLLWRSLTPEDREKYIKPT